MSYPHGIAAANRLVAATLEWADAYEGAHHSGMGSEAARRYIAAIVSLEARVREYRSAVATEHVQGPDMDARS